VFGIIITAATNTFVTVLL